MSYGRRAPRVPKISEAHIQETCTQLLELDGWRALRTDPVSRREWGKGFGEKGMVDYLYIRYAPVVRGGSQPVYCVDLQLPAPFCELMWIEWKKRGGKSAQHQLDWQAREIARGALVLVAGRTFPASIEGFIAWYNQSGLARRRLTVGTGGILGAYGAIDFPDPLDELGRIAGESIAKCRE